MSSQDRLHEVDALFRRALEREESEQRAFVRAEAADDPTLLAAVLELLDVDADAPGFLQESLEEQYDLPWQRVFDDPGASEPEESDRAGELIGPYRLERLVGRGGMASVYLAERVDGQFDQRVAVKLLRRGLDTDDVIRRFISERQILSSLSHPNIARLLDGGATADGLPYLVMEYVEGTPLLSWCDDRQATVSERLRLFAQVGRAVQHAHRSLVVHRDLKPANILVDQNGVVKLLDFGIAKLLADDAEVTRTGLRAMTPAYASPELVRGDPITTASDVYQLGLVLCQLLVGKLPYEVSAVSPARAERLILEATPTQPSTLANAQAAAARSASVHELTRLLSGDLDVITLQALRPEPESRYGSAEAFVEDVERHLRGEPVRARPATVTYRLRKFVARNAAAVAVASTLIVALVGSAAFATWQARRLAVERDRAVSQENRAEQVTAFLTEMFRITDPNEGAADSAGAVALLERGANRAASELASSPEIEADVLSAIGQMYLARGLDASARPVLTRAVELREGPPDDPEALVRDLVRLGQAYKFEYDERAVQIFEQAIHVAERRLGPTHVLLAEALIEYAEEVAVGPGVREATMRALAILEGTPDAARAPLASALHLSALGDGMERFEQLERALEIRLALYGEDHTTVAATLNDMALKLEQFYPLAADTLLEKAAAINERIHGPYHHQTITIVNNLAGRYRDRGDCDRAEPLYQEVLRRRLEAYPNDRQGIVYTQHGIGWCLTELGRAPEAEVMLRGVVDYLVGRPAVIYQMARSTLGRSLAVQGRYDEAEPLLVESHDWMTANGAPVEFTEIVANRVVDLYERMGRPALADRYRPESPSDVRDSAHG